jgi:hypothetical protein
LNGNAAKPERARAVSALSVGLEITGSVGIDEWTAVA